jgi:hypothetical protein
LIKGREGFARLLVNEFTSPIDLSRLTGRT